MGRNRFPAPEIQRLPLSDGDWIEIKKKLNNGDQKRLEAAGTRIVRVDGRLEQVVDWERHDIERAAIFLEDWSFKDANDKPVALKNRSGVVSIDALRALDTDSFEEVNTAILNYVMEQAREKAKASQAKNPPKATENPSPTPGTEATKSSTAANEPATE